MRSRRRHSRKPNLSYTEFKEQEFAGNCRKMAVAWAFQTLRATAPHLDFRAVPNGWLMVWLPQEEGQVEEVADGVLDANGIIGMAKHVVAEARMA